MPSKKELSEEAQATMERKDLLRQAYGKATSQLRDAHRDEFNNLYSAAAAEAGVEWKPRLNEKERAEAQFDALIADFPELRERLAEAQQTG